MEALIRPAAFVSIAASSVLYSWIWYRPQSFVRLVKPADPCMVMAKWANVIKFFQFATVLACTNWALAANVAWYQWLFFAVCVAFGQHLNFLVYHRLGIDGVYYGSRFGKTLPWVSKYPYNTYRDPQYIGCIATLAGCAILAPAELSLWWFANYLYLMWLESKVPADI